MFAPQWEDQQWRGTIAPGRKAQIKLPVELASGAHGNYLVSLKFGGKVLAEQPWGVGRPWGVTLFWILLCVVVPGAVFRIGMAVVDRLRPRRSGGAGRHRGALHFPELAARRPKFHPRTARQPDDPTEAVTRTTTTTALPWFTPDTDPGAPAGQLSAPSDNSPTTKGNT